MLDKKHIEDWYEKRKSMPKKGFLLTFNLINGNSIRVKTFDKDVFEIITHQLSSSSKYHFPKTDINEELIIYVDHVLWADIAEIEAN
ncbi:hypothetical protein ACWA2B_09945 [Paenibacillus sp. CMM36]